MLSLHLGAASTKSKQTHSGLKGKPPPHHKTSHVSLDFCRSRFPALQVNLKKEIKGNKKNRSAPPRPPPGSWAAP